MTPLNSDDKGAKSLVRFSSKGVGRAGTLGRCAWENWAPLLWLGGHGECTEALEEPEPSWKAMAGPVWGETGAFYSASVLNMRIQVLILVL